MKDKIQLFLDCDGVLADFDAYTTSMFGMPPREYEKLHGDQKFWEDLKAEDDLFFKFPLMSDALELWEATAYLDPIILTGCPKEMTEAHDQKRRWAKQNFDTDRIITCRSKDKRDHMVPDKVNIIIDDWHVHKRRWEEVGGHFILHKTTKDSIAQLEELLYELCLAS